MHEKSPIVLKRKKIKVKHEMLLLINVSSTLNHWAMVVALPGAGLFSLFYPLNSASLNSGPSQRCNIADFPIKISLALQLEKLNLHRLTKNT